jgi:hypothetical protein
MILRKLVSASTSILFGLLLIGSNSGYGQNLDITTQFETTGVPTPNHVSICADTVTINITIINDGLPSAVNMILPSGWSVHPVDVQHGAVDASNPQVLILSVAPAANGSPKTSTYEVTAHFSLSCNSPLQPVTISYAVNTADHYCPGIEWCDVDLALCSSGREACEKV